LYRQVNQQNFTAPDGADALQEIDQQWAIRLMERRSPPFTIRRSPFTVRRSPFTVRNSGFGILISDFCLRSSVFWKNAPF
jgi:hypothetical protein